MKKSAIIHSDTFSIIYKIGTPPPYEFLYKKIGKEKTYYEIQCFYERHRSSGPLLLEEMIKNFKGISFEEYKSWVQEYRRKYSNPAFSNLFKFLKQKDFISVICTSNPIDFYLHLPVKKIFATELMGEDNSLTGKYAPLSFPYKLDPIFYEPNRYGLLASFYFWAIKNKIDLSWTVLIGPSIPASPFSYFLGKTIYDNGGIQAVKMGIERFLKERKEYGE